MDNASVNNDLPYVCDDIFDFTTISGVSFIVIFILSVTGNGLLCVSSVCALLL